MAPRGGFLACNSGIHAAYALLKHVTSHVEAATCEEALANLMKMLKQSSAMMRLVIPLAMLVMALSRYSWIAQPCTSLRDYLYSFVSARVTISGSHPLQKQVMAWMIEHGLGERARTLALTPPQDIKVHKSRDYDQIYGLRSVKRKSSDSEEKRRDTLVYVPDVGRYSFTFEGSRMTFEKQTLKRDEYDQSSFHRYTKDDDTIIISCFSPPWSGARPIQAFLDHVKTTAAAGEETMTKIFRPAGSMRDGNYWDEGMARPSRKLSAVTLDAHIKDPLVKDIESYLDPRTKRFYVQNGIPYRKGYLLYGPPGTGKTSFSTALAGEYGLNVYLLSLSDSQMTDRRLEELFEQLPPKCVVLMEDIDSAGIKREDMRIEGKSEKRRRKSHLPPPIMDLVVADSDSENGAMLPPPPPFPFASFAPAGVTLSGLLNVLDGIHAAEGRIVLMTSNNPNSLDKALIRPGRIDRKVLFGYTSQEVAAKLFMRIFTKSPDQLLGGEKPFENVPQLATAFAEQIPPDEITPAAVQGHLLQYRADPEAAVAATAEMVAQEIEERRKGLVVAGFDEDAARHSRIDSESESESDSVSQPEPDTRPASRGRSRKARRKKAAAKKGHAHSRHNVAIPHSHDGSQSASRASAVRNQADKAALYSSPEPGPSLSRPETPASSVGSVRAKSNSNGRKCT